MRFWDVEDERCFACGERYPWGTPGAGRTLALCPECNAVAEDVAPDASYSFPRYLAALILIAVGWRLSVPWLALAVGGSVLVSIYVRLERLGGLIRSEREKSRNGELSIMRQRDRVGGDVPGREGAAGRSA